MKKMYLIPALLMIFAFSLKAQEPTETKEKYGKEEGNAVTISLEGQKKNVEDVLKAKFKKMKSKNEKGYTVMRAAVFEEISSGTLDIYYKVEKQGDTKSKVIMMISKGYDNFMSSSSDPTEIDAVKGLLKNMVTEVRRYELQIAVDAQAKVLEKAIKTQENLVKDHEKLVKDKAKLEQSLEDNAKNTEENIASQENQKTVIEEQKKLLEELQQKLSSVK